MRGHPGPGQKPLTGSAVPILSPLSKQRGSCCDFSFTSFFLVEIFQLPLRHQTAVWKSRRLGERERHVLLPLMSGRELCVRGPGTGIRPCSAPHGRGRPAGSPSAAPCSRRSHTCCGEPFPAAAKTGRPRKGPAPKPSALGLSVSFLGGRHVRAPVCWPERGHPRRFRPVPRGAAVAADVHVTLRATAAGSPRPPP